MSSSNLKDLSSRLGLTHDDIAAISGRNTRSVRSWLSGAIEPPTSVLLILMAIDEGLVQIPWLAAKLDGGH
jgi:DNA-binding transcriptional regulator YiaG